jgi:hypothetical protein
MEYNSLVKATVTKKALTKHLILQAVAMQKSQTQAMSLIHMV